MLLYTNVEKAAHSANDRAINAIFSTVDLNKFSHIYNCEIAEEAWDILVTTDERTDTVKQSILQRVTTNFELIRMDEDESFKVKGVLVREAPTSH